MTHYWPISRGSCRLWWIAAGLLAGCRSPEPVPAPFRGPELITSLRYFTGSPLSGPEPVRGALNTDDLCPFEVTAVALEQWRPELLEAQALGSQARMLAVPRGEAPVKPLPRLTASVRVASSAGPSEAASRLQAGQLGRSTVISVSRGALPRGVTAVHELKGRPSREGRVEVHVHRRQAEGDGTRAGSSQDDEIQVALMILGHRDAGQDQEGPAESPDPAAAAPVPAMVPDGAGDLEREFALLDRVPAGDARMFAIFLPSPFRGEQGEAIAFLLETGPAGPEEPGAKAAQDPDLARAIADLKEAGVSPIVASAQSPPPFIAGLPPALHALAFRPVQRNGLLVLARESDARLAEDIALVADPETLSSYCELVLKKSTGSETELDPAQLAFLLESTAVEELSALLSKEKLPAELHAVLVRHAGQAGRQVSSLEAALSASRTVDALRARIVEENWIALEDTSPPARVRAHDWLLALGQAPEGFDPLAPPRERRAILEKALETRSSAAQPPVAK
ncbi:MAG TPA: hypothetical protein VMT52_19225 [Planctomycetota bacterium]|nr:hypothetical protein [Planctomycetota bacterium]